MKAVWSFWDKPFQSHHHRVWASERHHLLAWVLSTQTARQHYRTTELHTDDAGARMLVDGIGLEFDRVCVSLNALRAHDPGWWALQLLARAGLVWGIRLPADLPHRPELVLLEPQHDADRRRGAQQRESGEIVLR